MEGLHTCTQLRLVRTPVYAPFKRSHTEVQDRTGQYDNMSALAAAARHFR
jgi:hypothetical protein